jgi:tetratricopeptide (TPR) repeat protein
MPRIKRILVVAFGTLCLVFSPTTIYGQSLQENAGSKPKQGAKAAVESPPVPAVEYDPHSWKEFADERAMFSIMFPGTPVEGDNSSDKIAGRKFTLKTSAFYFVGYQALSSSEAAEFEKHVGLRKQLFDKIRDGIRDATLTQTKVNLLEEADISINGYPGRAEKLSMENGDVWRQHAYLVEKRIYQIFVFIPRELLAPDNGQFDETRATKFLTSFKLGHPKNNQESKPLDSPPGSAKDFLNSCFARYKQKDWDRAIADCSKAIELDPQLRDSYLIRGTIFRDAKGNLDGAIADFDRPLK